MRKSFNQLSRTLDSGFVLAVGLGLLSVMSPVQTTLGQQAGDDRTQVDIVVEQETRRVPAGLTVRVRVTDITPKEPLQIDWRFGGEGLSGSPVRGVFGRPANTIDLLGPKMEVGEWSEPVPFQKIARGAPRRFFLTIKAGNGGKPIAAGSRQFVGYSRDMTMEIEFSYEGKVIKTLREKAVNGGTVGIVVPFERLTGGKTPASPEFLDELTGLLDYAKRRADYMESLPWAKWPVPSKYSVTTDLGGYGEGNYFGIRHNDPAIIDAEARSLRQLGVNGLRGEPGFLMDRVRQGDPAAKELLQAGHIGPLGFPAPRWVKEQPIPESGCPFAPGVPGRQQHSINRAMEALKLPVREVWALTVDEIGAVVDQSPEGKRHLAVCDYCAKGYHDFLTSHGITPADLGKPDWAAVRPYDVWTNTKAKDKNNDAPWLVDPKAALGAYYTRLFIGYATVQLFTPLRQALNKTNEAKRQAIAAGRLDSPEAKQPWVYSYALRGNSFLLGGHSLDFFNFYRHADNAFVYETSNRDARIWQWDSYLCDVTRYIGREQGLVQGIYVKPHRGAPIQRALTAAARGVTYLYWYTYGPDYSKGDNFSDREDTLALTSKAAHLIGKAEPALFGAKWAEPVEVAIIKPFSSDIWMGLTREPFMTAAYENAKWTHTGLTHADIKMDALDEDALVKNDLSNYKVICYMGPHITRTAAAKLAKWVEAGGTLYTSGAGLMRDEANQPLDALLPVLGLEKRTAPEMWRDVPTYGTVALEGFSDPKRQIAPVPDGLEIKSENKGDSKSEGPFAQEAIKPIIGREILHPRAGAQVLARYSDGGAAATVNNHGKGQVYVVGFFPGLEYSVPMHLPKWNMATDFSGAVRSYIAGPALTKVQPTLLTSSPTVEAVFLKQPESGQRSLVLMNWAYRVAGERVQVNDGVQTRSSPLIRHAPQKNVKVWLKSPGEVTEVFSLMLDRKLDITREPTGISVTLPELEEGDVLLLK